MEPLLSSLASPAAGAAVLAAVAWAPATGFPTWPALARGRLGSTLSVAVAALAYAQCLAAQASR